MSRIVEPTAANMAAAAAALKAGQCIAFPTETVYGLGADTFNAQALQRVYELKGRPADNPLIAHVLEADDASRIARGWDVRCELLAKMFWPGPLTLVLRKLDAVPAEATAGLNTIAVRSPSHDVARALLKAFGGPISAPSANRSGHVSSTTAEHVASEFQEFDLMILQGGPSRLGIESTVLDMTGTTPRILRPGMVTKEQLRPLIGEVESEFIGVRAASPGTSHRHYAPRTPSELVAGAELRARLSKMQGRAVVLCFDAKVASAPHRAIIMPGDVNQYAARLYGALREADAMGCDLILIEQPPESDGMWNAVWDRLRRATAK